MARVLGAELPAFLAAMEEPPVRGVRINPAKTDAAELSALLGVRLDPVPWSDTGFVLPPDAPSFGHHPAIDCGLFYLQDPASMVAPAVLAPGEGWRVADVAAAPGGKTTDLAARVGSGGLVLANEVVRSRLRLLEGALDRWGSREVVTSALDLDRLGGAWDGVLLDAPCTGEALFRRDPDAARGWSEASVLGNARRQARLLDAVAPLVRPGGVLVYSTCSFEPAEDEEQVASFLDRHAGWELEDERRIWPHRDPGDGQFVARLVRSADADWLERGWTRASAGGQRPDRSAIAAWRAFREETLPGFAADDGDLVQSGDRLYLSAGAASDLPLIDMSRPGLPLGRVRPGRFEPAPALATAIEPGQASQTARSSPAYLRGETVAEPGDDGWVLITYERWGLGWARRSRGVLKNFFPKGQRRRG
jgi:16S rRNA C967 or C1407 C5-methylase (RsmB/RsmF family)/NOL1/NOP2/fmu family ribosome biogenesis protein